MDIKKFAKDHKKELIIGGVVITVAAGSVVAWKLFKGKVLDITKDYIPKLFAVAKTAMNNDLPKPTWDGIEVLEHWNEGLYQNMILNCHPYDLGKLGDLLINDLATQANADLPVEIILSYGSSCWIK